MTGPESDATNEELRRLLGAYDDALAEGHASGLPLKAVPAELQRRFGDLQELIDRLQNHGQSGRESEPLTGAMLPGTDLLLESVRKIPNLERLELLGRGGMGVVYKAWHVLLECPVAVKVLPLMNARTPFFVERFAREAIALARLHHPRIVKIHDLGDVDGLYYLIMEHLAGNLRRIMTSDPMPPGKVLHIILPICDALEYAHSQGVIHRDIKPENILLDEHGRVKIADFGLAKLLGTDTSAATLTGSHQVMGSPHYMAPEQWERPNEVDHRVDIYALGVICYELLTGELPLGRFDPPSEKAFFGNRRLDEIVLRALARDQGQRFQSVFELKTELKSLRSKSSGRMKTALGQQVAPLAHFIGLTNQIAEVLILQYLPRLIAFAGILFVLFIFFIRTDTYASFLPGMLPRIGISGDARPFVLSCVPILTFFVGLMAYTFPDTRRLGGKVIRSSLVGFVGILTMLTLLGDKEPLAVFAFVVLMILLDFLIQFHRASRRQPGSRI